MKQAKEEKTVSPSKKNCDIDEIQARIIDSKSSQMISEKAEDVPGMSRTQENFH